MSNLVDLKAHLSRLNFVQVKVVVVKDEDVIAFDGKSGSTVWNDEPSFITEKEKYTPKEWKLLPKSCRHYYGFTTDDVFFQMSDQVARDRPIVTSLGIDTIQNRGMAPKRDGWLVGTVIKVADNRRRLIRWAVCTEQERQFACLLLGKISVKDSSDASLDFLKIKRPSEKGCSTDRLVHMARLLILRDIQYYLKERLEGKAMLVDANVLRICGDYDPNLWSEYEYKAREQRVYSSVIPEPAPLPIRDNITGVGQTVPLLTPFGKLKI